MTDIQEKHQSEKKIFITIGDVAGIGPEVVWKSIASFSEEKNITFHLVGPAKHWDFHKDLLLKAKPELVEDISQINDKLVFHEIETSLDEPKLGLCDKEQGRVSIEAIRQAVALVQKQKGATLVTAPISKESIKAAGSTYPGHTEMLRDFAGAEETTMAFVGGGLVLALATIHVPLSEVPKLITQDVILKKTRHLDRMLKYLGTKEQRIAVCGLNPHAGEAGMFGNEEIKVIKPAIEKGKQDGLNLDGPIPGDTAFYAALREEYDAVLAMFHDQGLAPLKTLAFDSAVNVTLGLPFIRTSPDHGTAYNITGKGVANPLSMRQAILLATKFSRSTDLDWS